MRGEGRGLGERPLPLDNTEITELFFDLFNPGETGKQFLTSGEVQ